MGLGGIFRKRKRPPETGGPSVNVWLLFTPFGFLLFRFGVFRISRQFFGRLNIVSGNQLWNSAKMIFSLA
jgi:hypothetical protein